MTTFLELTNRVLRKINETELTTSTFGNTRNLHSMIKDAVNDTIDEINKRHNNWPFNAFQHTHLLVPGKTEYIWPNGFKVADWDSFQIVKDLNLGNNTVDLRKMNRDEWYEWHKSADDDAGSTGRGIPQYVFEAHGQGFGVTPSPDKEYTIRYRYFSNPARLVNATDTTTIPPEWDYVIIAGTQWHAGLFKEDLEKSDRLRKFFDDNLGTMSRTLVGTEDDMRSHVVNNGGNFWYVTGATSING